jgi:hypothetical protein
MSMIAFMDKCRRENEQDDKLTQAERQRRREEMLAFVHRGAKNPRRAAPTATPAAPASPPARTVPTAPPAPAAAPRTITVTDSTAPTPGRADKAYVRMLTTATATALGDATVPWREPNIEKAVGEMRRALFQAHLTIPGDTFADLATTCWRPAKLSGLAEAVRANRQQAITKALRTGRATT